MHVKAQQKFTIVVVKRLLMAKETSTVDVCIHSRHTCTANALDMKTKHSFDAPVLFFQLKIK